MSCIIRCRREKDIEQTVGFGQLPPKYEWHKVSGVLPDGDKQSPQRCRRCDTRHRVHDCIQANGGHHQRIDICEAARFQFRDNCVRPNKM